MLLKSPTEGKGGAVSLSQKPKTPSENCRRRKSRNGAPSSPDQEGESGRRGPDADLSDKGKNLPETRESCRCGLSRERIGFGPIKAEKKKRGGRNRVPPRKEKEGSHPRNRQELLLPARTLMFCGEFRFED